MSSPWEPLLYAFAGVVLAMIIVINFPVCCRVSRNEGFENLTSKIIPCPKNTRSFTNMKGDTMCCKGQVEGNFCDGNVVCTMSGNSSKDVPTCKKLRDDKLSKIQIDCPTTVNWKSYLDDDSGTIGCAENTNAERTAPLTPATNYCQLYNNENDNYEPDSCQNFVETSLYNTIFKNRIKPDFCMTVNVPYKDFVGFAKCDDSFNQSFKIENNTILNKRGILNFSGAVGLTEMKFKDASSVKMTIIPQLGGGFLIKGNEQNKCYGPDKYNYINSFDCDPVKHPNIVWNSTPVVPSSSVSKQNSRAPKGYKWKCDIVPK